ncbi:hypothetical protein ABBQ38_001521 [Trebouxia sp. C0009 RCD-2024]
MRLTCGHRLQQQLSILPVSNLHQHKSAAVSGQTCNKHLSRKALRKGQHALRTKKRLVQMQSAPAIEQEQAVASVPDSLCKESSSNQGSMRVKFEAAVRRAQDDICKAVSEMDGKPFHEDAWVRPGGGGGVSRVLQGGNVWEKAGVNVSVVYGSMPPEAYRAATGTAKKLGQESGEPDRVPFFACGISSVMHPQNPFAPTMHFNYRYFETEEWNGVPSQWWFGGGTDITPSYINADDLKHFHGAYKAVCEKHDPEYWPKFKKWCDDYFVIKHRNNERRGCGGIFFDDLNDKDADTIFNFSQDCQQAVVDSYLPLVAQHKDDDFTEKQKQWQQMRRGRYVEFNLVYDRGTTFGLKTGGRIESILMSLPLTSRWEYNVTPEPGSPEADLLDACLNPRQWA